MNNSFNKKFFDIFEFIYALGYYLIWPYVTINYTTVPKQTLFVQVSPPRGEQRLIDHEFNYHTQKFLNYKQSL